MIIYLNLKKILLDSNDYKYTRYMKDEEILKMKEMVMNMMITLKKITNNY